MRPEVRHVSQTQVKTWETVEECVYAYELDFRDGQTRPLDEYLPPGSPTLRRMILVELIKVELALLWKEGVHRPLTDYPDRYPALGPLEELPPDLIYEAYLVANQYGEPQELDEFCAAYPRQRNAVLSLAYQTVNQSTAITRQKPGGQWQIGTRFGDFELLAILGEGAFGKVFLANQVSLARQVALKITANRGSEARTMASLEHDNIVQVFSELILPQHDARLLCMQYVPGTTLGKVIRHLGERPGDEVTGERILDAIDHLSTIPAALEATALKQRHLLAMSDLVESVTLLGTQLAGALSYAHERGVLHRDIKPDNVLISQYGRPLLVDFNLSLDPHQIAGTSAGMFGGSLAYMSPEHLDAFNPIHETTAEAVDERSDLYSLGVTLYELLHQQRPFPDPPAHGSPLDCLDEMATQRRTLSPAADTSEESEIDALDSAICRCLDPDPDRRYQTADELCEALQASRQLHVIRQALPVPGKLLQMATRKPLLMLILAVLIPSLLGSGINISYNLLRIVDSLTADQKEVFNHMLLAYNLTIYPICVGLLAYRALPIFRRGQVEDREVVRRRIVSLPVWIVALGALGWLPGAVVFPLGLHLAAGPLSATIFGHLVIDFLLSAMIAVTYSYFGAEAILLRVLYPRFLIDQPMPQRAARRELRRISLRIKIAQVVAAMIPLLAAILVVLIEPAEREGEFRFLVTVLIALGMIGFCFSMTAVGVLQRTLQALTGMQSQRRVARV